jgi:hypothetical protein
VDFQYGAVRLADGCTQGLHLSAIQWLDFGPQESRSESKLSSYLIELMSLRDHWFESAPVFPMDGTALAICQV